MKFPFAKKRFHRQKDRVRVLWWALIIVFVSVFGVFQLSKAFIFLKSGILVPKMSPTQAIVTPSPSLINESPTQVLTKSLPQSPGESAPTLPPLPASPKPSSSPQPSTTPLNSPPAQSGFCLSVPILMYHHIKPMDQAKAAGHGGLTVDNTTFAQQLAYLNDHKYTSLDGEAVPNALKNHTHLPLRSVVVTADDGYDDLYTYAFPLIKQYNIKLNIMIPTGLMNNPGYLSWEQLKEMVNSGLVFAYDHTWSHQNAGSADRAKEEMEILTAKKQLEEHLGKTVTIFAYPYGASNATAVNILSANGFIGAYSTIAGSLQCENNILSLHRTRVSNAPLSTYGL